MSRSSLDLKDFYRSKNGALIRRIIARHIRQLWPEMKGLRVMGTGYAQPYLRGFLPDAERIFALTPASMGIHFWPEGEKGLACLCDSSGLPVETESVDRILVVHGFEHALEPEIFMHELWRVLKSSGRILLVVPNRMGLWARAEWTPFGHGTPYTQTQLHNMLRQHLFVPERTDKALFMPPFRSSVLLRTAFRIENIGRRVMPGLAGLNLIEASKQIYAGIPQKKSAISAGKRRVVVTEAVPT